jgi:uncharacterized protein
MLRRSLVLLLALLAVAAPAQEAEVRAKYRKIEAQIPMRDGVRLFTSIYVPRDAAKPAPMLMMRTPYSVRPYGTDAYRAQLGPEPSFLNEGYIFVYQDVRGRFMSEGDFAWMRPYRPVKGPRDTDETTDTRDTIDWLLQNVPNHNGRVGVYGTSYPGHYAAQCLIDPHPALKAASPQAPMADNWRGDDMFHNGAFFLPHAMNFIAGFGVPREGPTTQYGPRVFQHGTPDGYRFFLEMGPIRNALERYNMNRIPLWKEWTANPTYTEYWQAQNVPQHLNRVGHVAVMTVGGWWDAEDLYGPLAIYGAIERKNPNANNILVMGPWYHGTWNRNDGTSLHDIVWTTKTGVDFRERFQKPFFRYHLWQDVEDPKLPEAAVFDVGADRWRMFDEWPPRAAAPLALQPVQEMGPGRENRPEGVRNELPRARLYVGGAPDVLGAAAVSWISDPDKPVPASSVTSPGMPRPYLIEDQRFVWSRPDVISFETAPLERDVTLAGPVEATLYVSTTGTDADFIVKLIDVLPPNHPNNSPRGDIAMGKYQMLIRGEPMRAKYRRSWNDPEPMRPGQVERVQFTLPDVMHTFKTGHRIMVQVQSSWFPVVDRNPQTFINIFEAAEKDFQPATHRLFLRSPHQSRLEVHVLP